MCKMLSDSAGFCWQCDKNIWVCFSVRSSNCRSLTKHER